VLNQSALKTKLAEIGMQPLVFSSPGDFDKFVRKQTERWTQVIRKAGITAEQ
jgi:tripartite-type tricarboxylate transporter receptor subunit TctC